VADRVFEIRRFRLHRGRHRPVKTSGHGICSPAPPWTCLTGYGLRPQAVDDLFREALISKFSGRQGIPSHRSRTVARARQKAGPVLGSVRTQTGDSNRRNRKGRAPDRAQNHSTLVAITSGVQGRLEPISHDRDSPDFIPSRSACGPRHGPAAISECSPTPHDMRPRRPSRRIRSRQRRPCICRPTRESHLPIQRVTTPADFPLKHFSKAVGHSSALVRYSTSRTNIKPKSRPQ
jgi:hypothetical protein